MRSVRGCPVTELDPSTVTDPTANDDACPGCGTTHGVQPTPAPPKVQAWTCTACGMNWAVTVVNPFLDRRAATVALRQVIALADQAPELTDAQLRDRLTALGERARR